MSESEVNSGINNPQIKKKKKFWTWKKALATALTTVGLGVGGFYFHKDNPTFLNIVKYAITDKFTETQQEKDFEKKFKVQYLGNKDSAAMNGLERELDRIKVDNSDALKHCNFIVLHKPKDLMSWYVTPFLDYSGKAWSVIDLIELCDNSRQLASHELGHIEHFNAPKEIDKELLAIHGDTLGKLILTKLDGWKELIPTWLDGTYGPKNGYTSPYASKNLRELVAEYIQAANSFFIWDEPEMQDPRCLQTIEVLAKYNQISQKQLKKIKDKLKSNNPEHISEVVLREVILMTPPRLINKEIEYGRLKEVYYDSGTLSISYYGSGYGSMVLATVQMEGDNYVEFNLEQLNGRIVPHIFNSKKNVDDCFPLEARLMLEGLGYDALFDWEKIKELRGEK
ncbi:hypothetical protein HZA97_08430 [Candidatus Woesearchaeota archaeon]|nr:hypothetical protein [Candidatus Woesearchaeota archaeon]